MLVLICQLLAYRMTVVVLDRQLGRWQKLERNKFANTKAFARDFRQTIMSNINDAEIKPSTVSFELTDLVLKCEHCFS